jgi:hypothetical protein
MLLRSKKLRDDQEGKLTEENSRENGLRGLRPNRISFANRIKNT